MIKVKEEGKKPEKDEKGKEKDVMVSITIVIGMIYELKEVKEKEYDTLSYLKNLK